MYTYINTYTFVNIHVDIEKEYTYTNIFVHFKPPTAYIYIYTRIYTHTCRYTYIHTSMCDCACVCKNPTASMLKNIFKGLLGSCASFFWRNVPVWVAARRGACSVAIDPNAWLGRRRHVATSAAAAHALKSIVLAACVWIFGVCTCTNIYILNITYIKYK